MSFIELYPIPWGQEPPIHLRQIYEDAFPPEEPLGTTLRSGAL